MCASFALGSCLLPLTLSPRLPGLILLDLSLPVISAAVLAGIFLIGLIVRGAFFLNRRTQEMRTVTAKLGLRPWQDENLPRGLSLQGTHFFRPTRMANVYEGFLNHTEVVVFDFYQRDEDANSNWARTVVAVKSPNQVTAPHKLECRKAGTWQLIYAPVGNMNSKELMDTDRLEILIKNIVR